LIKGKISDCRNRGLSFESRTGQTYSLCGKVVLFFNPAHRTSSSLLCQDTIPGPKMRVTPRGRNHRVEEKKRFTTHTVGLTRPGFNAGTIFSTVQALALRGQLHGAFFMSDKPFFASDKPFVAEACPPMLHASVSNGLSDIELHIENAPCNRPLNKRIKTVFPDQSTFRLNLISTLLLAPGASTYSVEEARGRGVLCRVPRPWPRAHKRRRHKRQGGTRRRC
jgi:hypothetical protein